MGVICSKICVCLKLFLNAGTIFWARYNALYGAVSDSSPYILTIYRNDPSDKSHLFDRSWSFGFHLLPLLEIIGAQPRILPLLGRETDVTNLCGVDSRASQAGSQTWSCSSRSGPPQTVSVIFGDVQQYNYYSSLIVQTQMSHLFYLYTGLCNFCAEPPTSASLGWVELMV